MQYCFPRELLIPLFYIPSFLESHTVKDLQGANVNSVTKTLLKGVMMRTTSKYACVVIY